MFQGQSAARPSLAQPQMLPVGRPGVAWRHCAPAEAALGEFVKSTPQGHQGRPRDCQSERGGGGNRGLLLLRWQWQIVVRGWRTMGEGEGVRAERKPDAEQPYEILKTALWA